MIFRFARFVSSVSESGCRQSITLPAISVWTCCPLANGDVVVGSSDGVIRIFTSSPDRYAPEEELVAFQTQVDALYRKRRITRCGAPETYSTPPTAHTAGAIGLIFGLEVHRVNINGATVAIFEFLSQTENISNFLIFRKVLILAICS